MNRVREHFCEAEYRIQQAEGRSPQHLWAEFHRPTLQDFTFDEKMIGKRSEFSAAEQRMLTQRSEFLPQMMKLLDKRVEPDAAQVNLLQRQSRADSRWVRPDRMLH